MSDTISINDAKINLSKYIAAAKKGKKIYYKIAKTPGFETWEISDLNNTTLRNKKPWALAQGFLYWRFW